MILDFSEITQDQTKAVGAKAANLAKLYQKGFPIPQGFVLTSPADIPAALNKFVELKLNLVAIRSTTNAEDSQNHSFAGLFDSYLNVGIRSLTDKISRCFASVGNERVKTYMQSKSLAVEGLTCAVIVQEMVKATISGVCFTTNPVTKDDKSMVIEAVWGLGEMLVSGEITPDTYILNKSDQTVLQLNTASQYIQRTADSSKIEPVLEVNINKTKLTSKQLLDITELCLKLEQEFGYPLDIEWSFADEQFYILQARPITTV